MSTVVGIDLGTTNSLVAHMTADGPEVIPNAVGERLTPSVVGIDENGTLLVGRAAKEYQVLQPSRCIGLFKRHMGSDWKATIAGKTFSAPELSSMVLRSLKADAEALFGHPVERAVITVPAYFREPQRQATIEAGKLAGLKVERIVNEPTAAALAYGFHESGAEKLLLVFDLGGGTFDVSLVELFEGAVEVRASAGEAFLGGEDFTRALASSVLTQIGVAYERAELQSPLRVSRLIQQCEKAKRLLTSADSATVRVPNEDGTLDESCREVAVARADFNRWTANLLGRCDTPVRRVLGDAKLSKSDVDEIILVGGATRMPSVMDSVGRYFGKPAHRRLDPDEVVALGAAVQAALIADHRAVEDMVVTDVCPFTLGIEISRRMNREIVSGYYLPIIERNTTLPASRVERVATVSANQTEMAVKIYQGEGRRVEHNLLLGELTLKNIPRAPAGEQSVDVRFTYDLNGVLEVECTVVETMAKAVHIVTRHVKNLDQSQIAAAVARMAELKLDPRDDAANRLLIRRAERLYQELPLGDRDRLSDLLDGFEQVLAMNDKEAILRYQMELQLFLDSHEPPERSDES